MFAAGHEPFKIDEGLDVWLLVRIFQYLFLAIEQGSGALGTARILLEAGPSRCGRQSRLGKFLLLELLCSSLTSTKNTTDILKLLLESTLVHTKSRRTYCPNSTSSDCA
jgi:hypothetical protein